MTAQRKDGTSLVERVLNLWNTRNFDAAREVYAPDYRGVDLINHLRVEGVDAAAREMARVCEAIPDLEFRQEQILLQDDQIALCWSARGTHRGTLMNIPPTGRHLQVNGMSILRISDGKIAHAVHLWDMAGLLRAVGLLPEIGSDAPGEPISFHDAFLLHAAPNLNRDESQSLS